MYVFPFTCRNVPSHRHSESVSGLSLRMITHIFFGPSFFEYLFPSVHVQALCTVKAHKLCAFSFHMFITVAKETYKHEDRIHLFSRSYVVDVVSVIRD